ncbi:hypothetical protein HOB10_02960 [Candidatus Parcubacteria bacterium]|jgi:hypothetical protein|nr:hypothetical protein [Candidatus Parcubacteria bacterium]
MCQIVRGGLEPETITALQADPFGISLWDCLVMDIETKIRKLDGEHETIANETKKD